jgi:hypothetical protein
MLFFSQAASALTLQITVTNNSPGGGTYLTPVWFGFHNGSFDSYDLGSPASAALEALAEDGDVAPISSLFGGVPDGRVQGVAGGGPIGPGQSVTRTIDVSDDGSNTYFSYASMVLPSSDYFVANDNPLAHSIADILAGVANEIVFNIGLPGTVTDAGTEVNSFLTSAGNGLFPGLGGGQTGPNQGDTEGGVVTIVGASDPYAAYLGMPGIDLTAFNFNDDYWSSGIATITISAVPVPAALPLFVAALGALGLVRRRAA